MDRIDSLLKKGADECLRRLNRMSRSRWDLRGVSLSRGSDDFHEDMLADVREGHFGSYLSVPGASFLVVFQRKGGLTASEGFTDPVRAAVEHLDWKEPLTLMEVSNILVNALITPFADSFDENWVVTPPEGKVDSQRGLLTWALKKMKSPGDIAAAGHVRLELTPRRTHCTILAFLEDALVRRLA